MGIELLFIMTEGNKCSVESKQKAYEIYDAYIKRVKTDTWIENMFKEFLERMNKYRRDK